MDLLKKLYLQLTRHDTLWRSFIILILLVIVFILYRLWPVYGTVFSQVIAVFRPFVIGFMMAYVLNPLVEGLEHIGLKRSLAMVLVYVGFIISLLFLVGILLPAVVQNISKLSTNLIVTAKYVQNELLANYQIDISELTRTLIKSIRQFTESLSLLENAFNAVNEAFGYFTSFIIYLVISIYMLSGFQKIKFSMKRLARGIHPYFPSYLSSLDFYMHGFLKGMVTLMLIRLVEYSFMYALIGHDYWKELGVLSAVCVFVPYLGALISSAVGIVTGFGLPTVQFVVMVLLMVILFFVDSYIVLPDIYSKEINTHPVWILFAMITGSSLFGFMGLLLSIPVFIALRVAFLEFVFFTRESV